MAEDQQSRLYYSARKGSKRLTVRDAQFRILHLFEMFQGRDFFFESLGITEGYVPSASASQAIVDLGFRAFPIEGWLQPSEDTIFDTVEFLFDHAGKPGPKQEVWHNMIMSEEYSFYDKASGQNEFRAAANRILNDIGDGFELGLDGVIRSFGSDGFQYIMRADIPAFDEVNVDSKVRSAIEKFRRRHPSLDDKKEAIRTLADVFEWLKKTSELRNALAKKDQSAIFEIANSFAIPSRWTSTGGHL